MSLVPLQRVQLRHDGPDDNSVRSVQRELRLRNRLQEVACPLTSAIKQRRVPASGREHLFLPHAVTNTQ